MEPDVKMKRIVLDRMERCSVCHRDFRTDDVHIINRQPDMWTMLVECTECHSRNFVAALMNDGDADEARLALRRLSRSAIEALNGNPEDGSTVDQEAPKVDPIAASDVVDIHSFLGEFDGDFKALFQSPKG
jgi:DNA-directed RNA polymerase subunit RPC12/RpoP